MTRVAVVLVGMVLVGAYMLGMVWAHVVQDTIGGLS